jgi:uncharacterized protein YodC (DUF2158 family)
MSAEPAFRILPHLGMHVVLNSGSPVMTVVDFYGPYIVCAWRDGDDVREATFNVLCVKVCKWDGK